MFIMILKSVSIFQNTMWNLEDLIRTKIRYNLFNKIDDEISIKIHRNHTIILFYEIRKYYSS